MKIRMCVNTIGLMVLLVQTSQLCAQEEGGRLTRARRWAGEKVGQVKEKARGAIDSLVTKAKKFIKDVKALRACHKEGTCTPEQYRMIRNTGVALASSAAVLAVGVGVMYRKPKMTAMTKSDNQLIQAARANNETEMKKLLPDFSKEEQEEARGVWMKTTASRFTRAGLSSAQSVGLGAESPYKERIDALIKIIEATPAVVPTHRVKK